MSNAQVLNLNPSNELAFEGPFTEVVTTQLTLGNPTEDVVYFKVKTTAPRYYCVHPNPGIIGPRGYVKISVILQPVDQPSTLAKDRTRHKFMIQSAIASTDDTPVDEFWKTVNPSDVMDTKLKVVFTNLGSTENGRDADSNMMTALLAQAPVLYYDYEKRRRDFGLLPIRAWLAAPHCKVLFLRDNTYEFLNLPLFEEPPPVAPIISSLMARFEEPPHADRTSFLLCFVKPEAKDMAARLEAATNHFSTFSELIRAIVPSLGLDLALLIASDADRQTVKAFDHASSTVRYHVV